MFHLQGLVRPPARAGSLATRHHNRPPAAGLASALLLFSLQIAVVTRSAAAFTHPGALVTTQELEFAKTKIAAGQQPNLTVDPTNPAATITAYIVQVSLGDLPHGTIGYQSIFAAGCTLFVMTLGFNILGHVLRKRFRQAY